MTLKELLKWPAKPLNGLNPWYLILYRVPFVALAYPLIAITTLIVTFGWGLYEGKEFWKTNT